MSYFIICLAAFLVSGLTLFSGFGLGTVLMPVFALFFPLEVAIALTAVVHLLNNFFKLGLLGKHADRTVVWRFGLPAVPAAFLGARTLLWLAHLQPWLEYQLWGKTFQVLPVKLVVACLMVVFALGEILPSFQKTALTKGYLPLGGLLSGFFGGLSGHQGALRSIFLLQYGLAKESFIATGVVIACLVDLSRILVYSATFPWAALGFQPRFLLAAVVSAFLGSYLGSLLLRQVTLRLVKFLVAMMVLGIALGLGSGLI